MASNAQPLCSWRATGARDTRERRPAEPGRLPCPGESARGCEQSRFPLGDALIHIRRTYTDGHLGEAKTETSQRTIDVNDDVVELLGRCGASSTGPTTPPWSCPGPTLSGYLPNRAVLRELYAAMAAAEIPREGPNGEKRTFHSWRHTFARIALEHGADLTWLSRHLGNSSTMVTDVVHGHWSRAFGVPGAGIEPARPEWDRRF